MQWISVKDRLPSQNEKVLVCYEKDSPDIQIGFLYKGEFRDGECFYLDDVTHWMPLPQPPEK